MKPTMICLAQGRYAKFNTSRYMLDVLMKDDEQTEHQTIKRYITEQREKANKMLAECVHLESAYL